MLFNLILKIIFRKDVKEMAVVYATLIIKCRCSASLTVICLTYLAAVFAH